MSFFVVALLFSNERKITISPYSRSREWNYIVLAGSKCDLSSLWNFINIILFRLKRFRGTKRLNWYTWCKIKRFSGTKRPWKCIWCRLKRFWGTELCWRPGQLRWGCAGIMGAVWQRRSYSSRSNWIFSTDWCRRILVSDSCELDFCNIYFLIRLPAFLLNNQCLTFVWFRNLTILSTTI